MTSECAYTDWGRAARRPVFFLQTLRVSAESSMGQNKERNICHSADAGVASDGEANTNKKAWSREMACKGSIEVGFKVAELKIRLKWFVSHTQSVTVFLSLLLSVEQVDPKALCPRHAPSTEAAQNGSKPSHARISPHRKEA